MQYAGPELRSGRQEPLFPAVLSSSFFAKFRAPKRIALVPDPDQIALVQRLFVQNMVAVRGFVIALMPDFGRVDDVVQETFRHHGVDGGILNEDIQRGK